MRQFSAAYYFIHIPQATSLKMPVIKHAGMIFSPFLRRLIIIFKLLHGMITSSVVKAFYFKEYYYASDQPFLKD